MTFRIDRKPELLRESRHARPYLPNFDTLPIYYISGILGFSNEFDQIAESLYEKSHHKRAIYCFQDKRNEFRPDQNNQFPEGMYLSLDEQASLIADEICANIPDINKNTGAAIPIVIAAYSYGCSLSALITNKIVEKYKNAVITLYMIDGSTPQCAYQYFKNNSLAMNQNLIEVINYACKNAGYTQLISQDIAHSIAAILQTKSFDDKFTFLEDTAKILNRTTANKTAHDKFKTYFTMIKNDLTELSKVDSTDENILAESIKLIATEKTQNNYAKRLLGWPQAITKLVLRQQLANVSHTELLSLASSALIAENIHQATKYIEQLEVKNYLGNVYDLSDDDNMSDSAYNSRSADEDGYTTSGSPSETSGQEITDNLMSVTSSDETSTVSSTGSSDSNTPQISHHQVHTPLDSEKLLDRLRVEKNQQCSNNNFGFFPSHDNARSQPINCPPPQRISL